MDLPQVAQALQRVGTVAIAVDVLFQYNCPLSEREKQQLSDFHHLQQEQIDGGLKVDEPSEELLLLSRRPTKAFHPLRVVQCVGSATRLPSVQPREQSRMQKQLLRHVAALTPLSMVEWCTALQSVATMCLNHYDVTPASLRCVEELLRLSAPTIWGTPSAAPSARSVRATWRHTIVAQPRKDTSELKLKQFTEAEAKQLFLKTLASLVQKYGYLHARNSKHSLSTLAPTGNEVFQTWAPVRRIQQMLQVNCCHDTAAVVHAVKLLSPLEVLSLAPVLSCELAVGISKDGINAAVKEQPLAIYYVLGACRPVAATLRLEQSDVVLQQVLYSMGLTTTTRAALLCYINILAAAETSTIVSYLTSKGKETVAQLLLPVATNADALADVAPSIRLTYTRLFRQLYSVSTQIVSVLLQAAAYALTNRCRAPSEKAAVMQLIGDIAAALPAEDLEKEKPAELVSVLGREVAVPAAETAQYALRLVSILHLEAFVEDGLRGALKNSKRDEMIRRALLVHLHPQRAPAAVVEGLTTELLANCEDVVVSRPDAYLALYFLAAKGDIALFGARCPLLCTADVLRQIDANDYERARAAEVSVCLAKTGYGAALVQLLTHRSGRVRHQLTKYVHATANDASSSISLWDCLTQVVFGIDSPVKPMIVGDSAATALQPIAMALLQHTARVSVSSVLAELLLCCGHDNVQGTDPYFLAASSFGPRRHCRESHRVQERLLRNVLVKTDSRPILSQHAKACATILTASFHKSSHVSVAACRAVVLLVSQVTHNVVAEVYEVLDVALKSSQAYFEQLSHEDATIAAEDVGVMAEYETAMMREQQLLKVYTDRPPKGVSEDDYAAMKKKDAVALAKGLEVLRASVEKRTAVIAAEVHRQKAVFLCIRLMGTNGHFDMTAVALFYPHLQRIVNKYHDKPAFVLSVLAGDAISGLLSHTPYGFIADVLVRTVARLTAVSHLTAADVRQVSALAHALRVALTQMLPASLFAVLAAFASVAFKAGRGANAVSTTIPVATQHQLLGMLIQNIGQASLPDPTGAMELFTFILQSFPALYKSIQQGFHTVMGMIPAEHLNTVEVGLFHTVDSVREVTAASFHRFAHFEGCRRALVLAATLQKDPSVSIAKFMTAIVENGAEKYNWALLPSDWTDLVYFLRAYGGRSVANATRIAEPMRILFARDDTTEATQEKWVAELKSVGGIPSVIALEGLSSTYCGNVVVTVMDYLCELLENTQAGESLLRHTLKVGRVVLESTDLARLKDMSPQLQSRLAKPPKDVSHAHKEQYLATATVWLTIMSCRLQETELLEAIIDQQSRTLNNSQSAMVHRCVCESMADISRNKNIRNSPKLDEFVEKCLKQCIHSGSYIKKKAHAWGLVGVIKGLGLLSLRRYGVMNLLKKSAQEKQTERSGVMVLLEVLCCELTTLFEPYALSMCSELLEGVADSDPKISECADDAAKELMGKLSGVGLRQLIPRLVEGLSSDVAKKRVPPLNFIGYVAFCSPKQLAAALPEIMKYVCSCLFDVNNAVSVAAFNALQRVAGVVSNPEIQEHVNLILNAMRAPSTDTEAALDALLYTRFVNMVDPASLALIIPVLSRGLGAQTPHTRPKAAQIVASMVNLVSDPKALLPYTDDLVRLLEESSQDPQAEARTTAAKAIAALAAATGISLVERILQWSFSVLQRVQAGAIEKAGAAQVLVEVVNACGSELLQVYFQTIESGMTDEKPPVREGFLYIMVYAPSTLSSECFQEFLPLSLPWVLEGLSHFSDRVRDVALAAGDSIVSLYGTRNLDLVLGPLLDGVVSEVTTLRHSSLLLSSKLMLHLVSHIKKKMRIQMALEGASEETRAEVETNIEATAGEDGLGAAATGDEEMVLTMEAARDVEKRGVSILGSLEEMLGTNQLVRMLSALFCGRHEHSANVRTDTNLAWQACVASIRAAVNKIFDGLTQLLVCFASSDNPDCVEVAEKTIEFTSRMNETIERFVDSFCGMYKSESRRVKLGSLVCLATVVQFAQSKQLVSMGGQIVGCVLPGMQEHDAVQDAAREVFARVSKSVGPRLIEDAVEAQLTTSVRGIVEVVKVKPTVALSLVFKHLKALESHTSHEVELLDAILSVEEAEEELFRYREDMVQLLLQFCVETLEGAQDVMVKYVASSPREYESLPVEAFQKAMNVPTRRYGALVAALAYGLGTETENVDGIAAVFRALIDALGDDTENTRTFVTQAIPQLLNSLEERVLDSLDEEERLDVMTSKRASGRYLLQYLETFQTTLAVTARAYISSSTPEFIVLGEGEPRLFDVLMTFFNRGLDYGTPQQKMEAVECIQDLMQFAPRAISAVAANTVAGRCSKVLFTRNEGPVVLALVRLCLQLMNYPASGKEKMVEGTMALAMFNAALCDSGEARLVALRVVIQLLTRSEKYADLILGTVVTKKSAVDSPLLRTVMCRFISVVMRYAHFTKSFPHINKLMDLVRPIWDAPDSPAQAAAAGVALGALCMSATVTDDVVSDLKELTLACTATKGIRALAGFSMVYSLIVSAPERTDSAFIEASAAHLRSAAGFGAADKLTSMWLLRAAAAVASTGCVSAEAFKVDAYVPLMRRANPADEQIMSTVQFFRECAVKAYPSCASVLEALPGECSSQWNTSGSFDADLDDEVVADTVY